MQKPDDISPFPSSITAENVNDLERRLKSARLMFILFVDLPRDVREARDRYDQQVQAGETFSVRTAIHTQKTVEVAHALEWTVLHYETDALGHGSALCHDDGGEEEDYVKHRLMLIRWDSEESTHYAGDVSDARTIEPEGDNNNFVSDHDWGWTGGRWKEPTSWKRYVSRAARLVPGDRVVVAGHPRLIVDISPLMGSVVLHFADRTNITVPSRLEITCVER